MTEWWIRAATKRNQNLAKIPQQWILGQDVIEAAQRQRAISGEYIESLLDDHTKALTNSSTESLLQLMGKGELRAKDVVVAFCKRAAYAHQLVYAPRRIEPPSKLTGVPQGNILLEITFDSAITRAAELDTYYEQHHRLIGDLHGLPFTMKDQWHIKGVDTSMAYVGWIGTQGGRPRTAIEDDLESQLVMDLSVLGAIPIGKTSLMQTTWSGETDNNILGYLWNPTARGLSAGGSSGGEGALQSLRGSSFGFGTDIGGSIAMPAAANGVYSFKPSHGRLSMKGTVVSSPGQTLIPTVAGILGSSIPDLQHVFRSLLSTKSWLRDPEVLPIPYRSHEGAMEQHYTFGVFSFDGVVMPHPPILRALRIVSNAVLTAGHKTIAWTPPDHTNVEDLHSMVSKADGQGDIFERTTLSREPFKPCLGIEENEIPPSPIPVSSYYNIAQKLHDWRDAYASYWNSTEAQTNSGQPVDAVFMPAGTQVAPRPGMVYHYGYSCVVNVLDYCSVVIPVASVDKAVDVVDYNYKPISEKDACTWKAYDPEIYHRAPIGVQIVCRRLEEEKLLAIAEAVVKALRAEKRMPTCG